METLYEKQTLQNNTIHVQFVFYFITCTCFFFGGGGGGGGGHQSVQYYKSQIHNHHDFIKDTWKNNNTLPREHCVKSTETVKFYIVD